MLHPDQCRALREPSRYVFSACPNGPPIWLVPMSCFSYSLRLASLSIRNPFVLHIHRLRSPVPCSTEYSQWRPAAGFLGDKWMAKGAGSGWCVVDWLVASVMAKSRGGGGLLSPSPYTSISPVHCSLAFFALLSVHHKSPKPSSDFASILAKSHPFFQRWKFVSLHKLFLCLFGCRCLNHCESTSWLPLPTFH